jgi:hypothetical protein
VGMSQRVANATRGSLWIHVQGMNPLATLRASLRDAVSLVG